MLSAKQREDFFIKLYFDTKNGFETAGLRRAYRDFNRTLKITDSHEQRDAKREYIQEYLKGELLNLISLEIDDYEQFDSFHERLCVDLKNKWNSFTESPEFKIGHAQKWINMTLKYWLLLGEGRIKNIEKNAKFFHIPIDSYVQSGMFDETYPNPSWSNIDSYKDYYSYQIRHRKKETGNPPIIDEFDFFNSI